jgi:hypothetical protein
VSDELFALTFSPDPMTAIDYGPVRLDEAWLRKRINRGLDLAGEGGTDHFATKSAGEVVVDAIMKALLADE